MPTRVALIAEAVEDLTGYARSGNLLLFLKKLVRLEQVGEDAGLPLGRGLTGYRKIVVGDRDWRIVFRMSDDGRSAFVVVVGDRDDAACYEIASRRMERYQGSLPSDFSLAEAMLQLMQSGKRPRRG